MAWSNIAKLLRLVAILGCNERRGLLQRQGQAINPLSQIARRLGIVHRRFSSSLGAMEQEADRFLLGKLLQRLLPHLGRPSPQSRGDEDTPLI